MRSALTLRGIAQMVVVSLTWRGQRLMETTEGMVA